MILYIKILCNYIEGGSVSTIRSCPQGVLPCTINVFKNVLKSRIIILLTLQTTLILKKI